MSTNETFRHPLADELLAYERMRGDLEPALHGRWIIVHDSNRVGGDYQSYTDAKAAALEMGLDVLSCFIRQVGVESAIFLSYGE